MQTSAQPIILFIDSDPSICQSLQTLLEDEPWDCRFASTTAAARQQLKETAADLVVTDTTLSDGDGISFLQNLVHEKPTITRMFLTTFNSQENIIQALETGVAQQLIQKPWIEQELKEVIRSAIRQAQQQKKFSPEFQELINSIPLLPALPDSYSNVRACVQGDDVDIEKMADYIGQDVAMTALLLRWANSALFGQRFQVDTIKKAIIVLGTDIVESLILSEAVNRAISGKIPEIRGFDLEKYKKHAMATACISRLLLKSLYPADKMRQDRAFVAGLLHDMGKLIAATYLPALFEKAIAHAVAHKLTLNAAERECYGSDHAELGGFLAEWWTLPPFIVNSILCHHAPKASPLDQDIIVATHVANLLSYSFQYGSNGDSIRRELADEYSDQFFLSEEAIEIMRLETEKVIRLMLMR